MKLRSGGYAYSDGCVMIMINNSTKYSFIMVCSHLNIETHSISTLSSTKCSSSENELGCQVRLTPDNILEQNLSLTLRGYEEFDFPGVFEIESLALDPVVLKSDIERVSA